MVGAARRVRELVSGSPLLDQTTQSGWILAQRGLRPSKIRRHLAANNRLRVMIGSGPTRVEGWLSTDLIPSRPDVVFLDASEPFPFAAASVQRIHTEHMIEHVDHPVGRQMLAECARVLAPGGRIRIATPDFERVVALAGPVGADVTELARRSNVRNGIDDAHATDPVYAVNRLFSGYGHRFLYTEATLRRELEAAGLVDVRRYEVGESDDTELAEVDHHGEQIDADWNRYQTLVLEAEKPSS
jgi:SAM-dependent methyltransferase